MTQAQTIVLRSRPQGPAKPGDFAVEEGPLPAPAEGEVLVASRYVTVDPYVRSLLDDPSLYGEPIALGGVPPGDVVGEVVASRVARLPVGSLVVGRLGWRSHGLARPASLRPAGRHEVPITAELSLLASAGLTAWFGVGDVLRPEPGSTVVVSGAAGAVGGIAAQLAKIKGARVVGIAGGQRKEAYLVETLGLDAAIDYKTDDVGAALDELCPDGVDGYFDNVGGPLTDVVLARLADGARVALCGEISQYDTPGEEYRPRVIGALMDRRATMTGFLVSDFAHRYEDARHRLAALQREGRLKVRDDVVEGFTNLPAAFVGMMAGDNIGKRLVKV